MMQVHASTGRPVAEALDRLSELASLRQPDDPLLGRFLSRYYSELPEDDVDDRKLEDLYAVAVAHLALGRVRAPGQAVARVLSPDRERDGWHSPHSVALVVTDDMPFLVDTIRMVLDRHGLGIHLLVHPMLVVTRDEAHRLDDVFSVGEGDGPVEAWTQIEIDRIGDEAAAQVEADILRSVDDVRRAVSDFEAMRQRMLALGDIGGPVLPWLADGSFVFLGSAEYDIGADGALVLRAGSELGLARDDPRAAHPRPMPDDHSVAIARTEEMSKVFRDERQTVVVVRHLNAAGEGAGAPAVPDRELTSERRDLAVHDAAGEGAGAPAVPDRELTSERRDLGTGSHARAQTRFIGLLATNAYRVSVADIPGFGPAALGALGLTEQTMHSHHGRATRAVLENLPRNLVFEQEPAALARLVNDIVGLQERQLVRVFEVPDRVGSWVTVLVYLPRSRFTAELPERIADVVAEAYGAEQRTFESFVAASSLARIAVNVRRPDGQRVADIDLLERVIDDLSTSWSERLREALVAEVGEGPGRVLFERIGAHAPGAYRAAVQPGRATGDVRRIGALLDDGDDMSTAVARDIDAPEQEWRFRVFRRSSPASLSELLPLLDNLGLEALDEQSYAFRTGDDLVYVYDIGVRVPTGVALDGRRWAELQAGFEAVVAGELESDGFNRLVLAAGLTAREVAIVRAYGKYLRQIGFAFSQAYIEATLRAHPALVADLLTLFHARFDPGRAGGGEERLLEERTVRERILVALDAIPSLDDDRICRIFLSLIEATVRTNFYRHRPAVALKLDPRSIAELPLPKPRHEIWVCGPRVEGVHLRAGSVARGGLRWSDRREDFRTEVLGLMKAQVVKNAVIVPTGAKGGFVVKRPPPDVEGVRTEGVECYRLFIRGLLDLTDNLGGETEDVVVHPPSTVIKDGDDTYFVVAADKGTATFSDVANEISAEYGFWLGDAFASGGSAGYDHKAMGITARGAWESVRRHARVLGKDADADPLTVVGIGDMSGDVFGNGMLRSRHLRLVAAFDHRHLFIDPSPDPEVSFAERQRLFDLPRSSWADYDPALLSPGGAVIPRTQKTIVLSPEARAVLGAPDRPLTPNEAISIILQTPVDLLWNGGIGTYVKASVESNTDVGDRANDGVRVDGRDLRARMVAEGGNLGLTQLGRVEYALGGGLVNTDAIDNSAGVDCSDHEVNIKILLDAIVAAGELTLQQRDELLGSMTDEVADLVLDNNKAQTLALLIARRQALPMVNVHARYIDVLEHEGWMDRDLEFLPSDKQIAERQALGHGLTSPEFAVLIAYTKNANVAEVTRSDLPDLGLLEVDLVDYFPTALRQRYAAQIRRHPLRREIIATRVVNQMVNQSGISFDHRVTEDTGASVVDVTRAWVAAREIFGFGALWREIDAVPADVPLDVQLELFLDARRMVERGVLWLLRHRRSPLDVAAAVQTFRPGLARLATELGSVLTGRMQATVHSGEASRLAAGVPEILAERAGVWPLVHTGFDVVEVAARHGRDVVDVARVQWEVFDRLDLIWLWDGIGTLPRSDRWQTQARSALRDDLLTAMAELTSTIVETTDGDVGQWLAANDRAVTRAQSMFTEIRRAEFYDLTTLSVALRQLRNLAR